MTTHEFMDIVLKTFAVILLAAYVNPPWLLSAIMGMEAAACLMIIGAFLGTVVFPFLFGKGFPAIGRAVRRLFNGKAAA
jgi:hypothetical protein